MAQQLLDTSLYADANLVGYWRFEDNALDETANNNDLTLSGSPSYATGKFGKGLDLELSSSQYAYIADNASLSITGDFSLGCWVNFESTPAASGLMTLLGKYNALAANQRSYILYLYNDGGTLKLQANIDQTGDSSVRDVYRWNFTPAVGTWYHVALTCDISNASATTFVCYVNGVSQGNGAAVVAGNCASIFDSTARFQIGADDDTSDHLLDGIVDDAFVFNRILTPTEIQNIYDRGIKKINGVYMGSQEIASTRFAGDANIKAYWKGDNTTDSGGGGYTLTNNNTVTFTAGKFGNAFTLNGSNQYLTVPKAALPLGTNVGSISMWIKFGATSGYMGILMNDNATEGLWLYYDNAGVMKFFNRNGTPGTSYAWTRDTNWHHWVFVRDGTNSKIYLDGTQVASTASCPNFVDVSLDYFLGAYNVNGTPQASWYFNGQIDDAYISSRALTSDEIYSLYKTGVKKLNGVVNLNPELESTSLRGDTNLVQYTRFEGNSTASVGTNGTDTNITYGTGYGKFGQGALFNGSTSKIVLGTNVSSLKITSSFSYSYWINTTSTSGTKGIINNWGANTGYGGFTSRFDGSHVTIESGNNTGFTHGTNWRQLVSIRTVNNGNWHQIVGVYDGSYLKIYIDGTLDNSVAWTNNPAYGTNTYQQIGCYAESASYSDFFAGSLDDFYILSRALTATEISNLYNTNIKKYMGVSNI